MHPLTDYIPSIIFVAVAFSMPNGTTEKEPLPHIALSENHVSVISPFELQLDGQSSESEILQFGIETAPETNSAGVELATSLFD